MPMVIILFLMWMGGPNVLSKSDLMGPWIEEPEG